MTALLRRRLTPDFLARALVGVLFALMSFNLLGNFLRTGHVTGLLLLASEFLVLVFTVLRRPAQHVDRSMAGRLMTTVSIVGPQLLRAGSIPSLAPDVLTAVVSAIGLCVVISGKLALGRSFGLVPANRGVVVQGPYTVVRHPIYLGYLVTHAAFLVATRSRSTSRLCWSPTRRSSRARSSKSGFSAGRDLRGLLPSRRLASCSRRVLIWRCCC